jgi:hypothetical protein
MKTENENGNGNEADTRAQPLPNPTFYHYLYLFIKFQCDGWLSIVVAGSNSATRHRPDRTRSIWATGRLGYPFRSD